jgi:hypothetical protein
MRKLFKKAEIYGSLASVYHGSQKSPEEFVKLWKSGNFAPGLGSGNMYGPGIYSVYERAGSATERGGYGDYIYKFIVNISDYLILDEAVFNTVHPRDANLPYDEKLKLQFKKFNISWNEEFPKVQPVFTSDIAEEIKDNGIHQGLIFTGRQDGNVCVIFNPYSARMVGYSIGKTEVRFTAEKIKENNVTREPLKRDGYTEEERWRYLANTYAKNKPDSFFVYFEKINAILGEEEAKRIALSAAQNLAEKDLHIFFYDYFDQIKDILGEADMKRIVLPAAQNLAENDPGNFFKYLHRIQAELGEAEAKRLAFLAAQNLAENNESEFKNHFYTIKKLLGEAGAGKIYLRIVKKLAEQDPVLFFSKHLPSIKTDLGEDVAKELVLSAAKSLAENYPDDFFSYYFDKIKNILREADAKEVANLAAKKLVRENPINFLIIHLDKIRSILEVDEIIDIAHDAVQNFNKEDYELFSSFFSHDYFLNKFKAVLGESGADKLKQIAESKKTTASSKSRRFNKIARYLRLAKIG